MVARTREWAELDAVSSAKSYQLDYLPLTRLVSLLIRSVSFCFLWLLSKLLSIKQASEFSRQQLAKPTLVSQLASWPARKRGRESAR